MSKRKLLTLQNLYDYYVNNNKTIHFSSESEKSTIVVQVPGNIVFNKSEKDTEGLCPVILQACHIDENLNGSRISEEVMTASLPSFSNRPILGYLHKVDDQWEFYGHNMHEDENGELVYDEIPIGVIPESCDAKLQYDEDKEKTYVVVNGYLFEEYSKATEVLQREGECSVSVELAIRELSYDAKSKVLDIEDMYFSGVTILGKTDDGDEVKPGMAGSNIKIADFMRKEDNISQNQKLIEAIEKLTNSLTAINQINNKGMEGGEKVSKFEELLNKYGKTSDDIDFDYESMTDEELEAKFEELFGEESTGDGTSDDGEDPVEPESAEEPVVEQNELKKYSIILPDGKVKEFELSLDDISYALYNLVNDTYSDQDNCWYSVSTYESYVIMHDYWNGKAYKQSYKREDDNFSLVGDRVEVFCNWLTADEEASLKEMRNNYSVIETELNKYKEAEENQKKDSLFTSNDYSSISEAEEYKTLFENHSELTYEQLKDKLDAILLNYAKSGKLNFSSTSPDQKGKNGRLELPINTPAKKNNRYGSIFKN